jgi:C4-dicarboxylate transporter, DctM subunit
VILLFSAVIGGIFLGIFTVTEAASIAVVLTFFAALVRGKLSGKALWSAATETTNAVTMVYPLIIGALILTFYLDLAGLPVAATEYVAGLGLSPLLTIVLLCVIFILLGTVMDSVAVMIITAGLVAQMVTGLGYDPIWWGVMMIVFVELGVVTPPFGMNLFVLKSIAPNIATTEVYRGVTPFILADLIKIALLIAIPGLALWLPSVMQ